MDGKKVALVTGANKGIGFEVSRQLGRHGFTVVLADRDEKKVADAAARLQAEGLGAHGVVLDVTDLASAEAAARWVGGRYERLDVLVNNAGVASEFVKGTKPSQLTMETLQATYDTNFFGRSPSRSTCCPSCGNPLLRGSSTSPRRWDRPPS
jgi:NAD(P)-dependent dehydrogenase (short-subunit alcohol dehydrogenase family)